MSRRRKIQGLKSVQKKPVGPNDHQPRQRCQIRERFRDLREAGCPITAASPRGPALSLPGPRPPPSTRAIVQPRAKNNLSVPGPTRIRLGKQQDGEKRLPAAANLAHPSSLPPRSQCPAAGCGGPKRRPPELVQSTTRAWKRKQPCGAIKRKGRRDSAPELARGRSSKEAPEQISSGTSRPGRTAEMHANARAPRDTPAGAHDWQKGRDAANGRRTNGRAQYPISHDVEIRRRAASFRAHDCRHAAGVGGSVRPGPQQRRGGLLRIVGTPP